MIDRDAELAEHLQELRTRLIRSIVFLAIGTAIAWVLYPWIYNALTAPIESAMRERHLVYQMMMTRLTEAFILKCQVSVIAGAIISAPLITMQIWGFVSPALTPDEKRPVRWVAPLCVFLFVLGVTIGYLILPQAMKFFVGYLPAQNTELRPAVAENLVFIVKMLLGFGIVFEMPIVLIFLGKLGVVDAKMLRMGWRHAMVAIAVLAAVATPSSDAISMLAMAIPLAGLYLISIVLVKMVEPKPLK